jgi:hypothetical protein
MLVTQVEMLLYHADKAEMVKMLDWLEKSEKFLFSPAQRVAYGFEITGYGMNTSWPEDKIRVDSKCRTGPFIDLRLTMKNFTYPRILADILRKYGWKIKGCYRQIYVDLDASWSDIRFNGSWTYVTDDDFPRLWDAGLDRGRQEGRRGWRR